MVPRLAVPFLLFSLAATAQPQPQEPLTRVTVRLVQVDAVVTDRAGRQVKNLEAKDFEILQDGVPQQVARCAYISTEAPPQPGVRPAGPLPPAEAHRNEIRRTIALVIDDLGLRIEHMPEVRRALHKFIDEQMRPGDLVAILRTGVNIGALQQFTTDRRKLHAAADAVRSNFSSRTGVGGVNGEVIPMAAGAAAGGSEIDTLNRLAYVIGSLRSLPGHKSVLLFAETDIIPLNAGGTGTRPALLVALDHLLDQATRSSAAIYTINANAEIGRDPAQFNADALQGGGAVESLIYLANVTGGNYGGNLSNDLSVPVAWALEHQQGYYLLAYTPDPKTFEGPGKARKFHKITVRVKGGGYTVRSNSGFLGSPDEPEPKPLGNGMFVALNSPFGSPDIELGMTSVFFDEAKGPAITALVNVKAADLTFSEGPEGRTAEGEIVAAVFGENGDAVYKNALQFTARLRGTDYERAMTNGFLFTLHLPMKQPGSYDVRVAVRDNPSGKIGTASAFLELPRLKKNRVAISGILLQTPAPAGVNVGADLRGGSALRTFRPGETLSYVYQVLNPKVDSATKSPKLEAVASVYLIGKPIFRGNPTPVRTETDTGRIPAGGSLKIGPEMPPGDYVLQVDVTDLLADAKNRKATQYIDFYVRP